MARKQDADLPIPDVPGTYDEAQRAYYDRGGGLNVDKHRAFLIIFMLLVLLIVAGISFNSLLPLKTVSPYRVIEHTSGKSVADFTAFKAYTPETLDIQKTLRFWAKSLYTILGHKQSIAGLEDARQLILGKAVRQFGEWFEKERPTVLSFDKPELTRTVEVSSVSVLPNNVALIRIITSTQESDNSEVVTKKLLITVKYVYVKPTSESDVAKVANGLYVEHFTIEDDNAS